METRAHKVVTHQEGASVSNIAILILNTPLFLQQMTLILLEKRLVPSRVGVGRGEEILAKLQVSKDYEGGFWI